MSSSTTGAPSSGGASGRSRRTAAQTEKNGKGKTVKFRGLTLILPPEAPGDLAFSIENNEVSAAVQEIFGDEQYVQIREKCKADKLTLMQTFEALRDLLNDCFNAWGLTSGESSASA
jgi:hypothetical protein